MKMEENSNNKRTENAKMSMNNGIHITIERDFAQANTAMDIW